MESAWFIVSLFLKIIHKYNTVLFCNQDICQVQEFVQCLYQFQMPSNQIFCIQDMGKNYQNYRIYMLNSNGNVYCHNNEFYNNKKIPLIFREKDSIIFQIDMIRNEIKWLNSQKQELYVFLDYKILDTENKDIRLNVCCPRSLWKCKNN